MARRGRPKAELVLSTEERLALERLASRRKSAQAMAMRARVVLTCAKGGTNRDVARPLGNFGDREWGEFGDPYQPLRRSPTGRTEDRHR